MQIEQEKAKWQEEGAAASATATLLVCTGALAGQRIFERGHSQARLALFVLAGWSGPVRSCMALASGWLTVRAMIVSGAAHGSGIVAAHN